MSITRKTQEPAGIVNASGQPEIVIELDGLVLSMKPPASADAVIEMSSDSAEADADAEPASEAEAGADLTEE